MTIKITIKTLDSRNYDFEVEDDLTVAQFKQRIEPSVNVSATEQRLIFCGRVLQDNSKLLDYDCHGKVIHLVQRAPPALNNNGNDPGIAANDSNNNNDNVQDLYLNGQNQPRFRLLGDDTNVSFSAMTLSPDAPIDADTMRQIIQGVLTYANQSRLLPDGSSVELNVGIPANDVHRRLLNAARMLRFTFNAINDCQRQLNVLQPSSSGSETNQTPSILELPNVLSLESLANERLDSIYNQLLECLAQAEDSFRPISQKHREMLNLSASISNSDTTQRSSSTSQEPGATDQEPSTSTQASATDLSSNVETAENDQDPPVISERNYQVARVLCQFVPRILHHLGHACHALSDFSTDLRRRSPTANSQGANNQEAVQIGVPTSGIAIPHISFGFGPIPLSNVRVHSSSFNSSSNETGNRVQSHVTLNFEPQRQTTGHHRSRHSSAGQVSAGQTPTVQTPTVQTPTVQTPTVQTPTVQTPTVQTPTVQTPAVQTPTVQTPTVQTPTVQTPTVQTPTSQTPTSQTPTSQTPTSQTLTSQIPTEQTQTGQAAAGQTSTGHATTEQASTEQTQAGQIPASQIPPTGLPNVQLPNQNVPPRGRRQPVGLISGTIPTPDPFDYYLPCNSRWTRPVMLQNRNGHSTNRQRTGSEPPPAVRQTQSSVQPPTPSATQSATLTATQASSRPASGHPNVALNQQTQTRPVSTATNFGQIPINLSGLIENAMNSLGNSFMAATNGQQANPHMRTHNINIIQNLGVIPEIARNAASAAVSQFFAAAAANPTSNVVRDQPNPQSAPSVPDSVIPPPRVDTNVVMMDVDNDSSTDNFVDASDTGPLQAENKNSSQQPASSCPNINREALSRVSERHQEWLPIIEEDIRIQERLISLEGRPLSDGYINSVPKKKRRLLTIHSESLSILQPSPSQSIETLLMRAINSANIPDQPRSSVMPIVAELAADSRVQVAYDEHVRGAVGERLKSDLDYDPSKFENSKKYFK